jgi:hypothetical protein
VQAAVFRLAPGGSIGRHPATVPQILAVLEGSGAVTGADGNSEPISPGEAVFWMQGEEHETTSVRGMTALLLEADGLMRFRPPTSLRTSAAGSCGAPSGGSGRRLNRHVLLRGDQDRVTHDGERLAPPTPTESEPGSIASQGTLLSSPALAPAHSAQDPALSQLS